MRNLQKNKRKRIAGIAASLILVIFLVCVILMLVSLRVQLVRVGYKMEEIRRQKSGLIDQQKLLLSELASLDSSGSPGSSAKFIIPDERWRLAALRTEQR